MRYRYRHNATVEMIEWTGDNLKDVQAFMYPASPLDHTGKGIGINAHDPSKQYGQPTKLVFINPGAVIVKNESAELTIYASREAFDAAFEPVMTNEVNEA